MPFDGKLFKDQADPNAREITWMDELLARLYCGRYGTFMRENGYSCMSSRAGLVRFTPYEERCFCEAFFRTDPADWGLGDHTMDHKPSGLRIWVSNGREFVAVYAPHEIPLRIRTQGRIYRAYKRLRRDRHRVRHSGGVSPEARDLIGRLATAHTPHRTKSLAPTPRPTDGR